MLKTILAVLLFCGSVKAESPVIASYRDFSGGLDNFYSPTALAQNESPNLLNVVIDEPMGALTQRKGYTACGTIPSGATATALYEYSKNDGSRRLIVSDNNTIWQTGDCINYSTIATNLGSLNLPRFATVQDNLWIVNGSTYPIIWNGTSGYYLDGASNRPLGPKGKLITYWKSRVWIGNTATSPSGLYFSALVDAQGNIMDPATSTNAWSNALNLIYFNRDNGSPLYGIKVYRDNLYAFKENDILRLVFESEYTSSGITVTKTVSKTGSKFQESIVEMDDGLLRFVGRDGVYAFDGSIVKRISTKWTPTFYTIKQPTHGEQYALWDSVSDFSVGVSSNVEYSSPGIVILAKGNIVARTFGGLYPSINYSTWTAAGNNYFVGGSVANYKAQATNGATYSGSLTASAGTMGVSKISNFSLRGSGSRKAQTDGTGFIKNDTARFIFISDSNNPNSFNGYGLSIACTVDNAASNVTCITSLDKCNTGVCVSTASHTQTQSLTTTFGSQSIVSKNCGNMVINISSFSITTAGDSALESTVAGVQSDTTNCSFSYTENGLINEQLLNTAYIDIQSTSWPLAQANVGTLAGTYYPYVGTFRIYESLYKSSGAYTSQISTATGLTLWKTFDVDQTNVSSTSISYQVRVASTIYNLGLASYNTIVPGSIVSASTNTFYQWKANLSTTDNGVTPILNSASVGWVTGDSSKSPLTALAYKSRYWLAASTGLTNSYNDMTMVESKSPLMTYTKYDLPLSAMTLWNDNLYGAIGNTSKIVRVDYGETDDGNTITSYWESRDEVYDNPVLYKTINTGILDYSNSPANTGLQIGLSSDMGATYQDRTVDLSASTLARNTIKLNYDANTAIGFRTRVYNVVPGIGFKIYGLHNIGTMTDFMGQ